MLNPLSFCSLFKKKKKVLVSVCVKLWLNGQNNLNSIRSLTGTEMKSRFLPLSHSRV